MDNCKRFEQKCNLTKGITVLLIIKVRCHKTILCVIKFYLKINNQDSFSFSMSCLIPEQHCLNMQNVISSTGNESNQRVHFYVLTHKTAFYQKLLPKRRVSNSSSKKYMTVSAINL